MPRQSRHSEALAYLHDRYFGEDASRLASLGRERLNARIARQIYDLRTAAGLTQRQLASLVGTTASVICQLEDSDYSGHSLSMLQRIASALLSRIELRFVPTGERSSARARAKKRKTG